jgi:FixJ family two-component response regulator
MKRARPGETVLVLDDDPLVLRTVTRMLQRLGYRALPTRTAAEALGVLADQPGPVHLFLTDVALQGTSGVAVAHGVRQRQPQIAVLYMSGGCDPGHESFLAKPFSTSCLAEKVRQALDTATFSLSACLSEAT